MKNRSEDGFALLDLVFVCGMIGVLTSIATPRMLTARQSAGAASGVGSLRAINSAQLSFAFTCGSGFYAPHLPALGVPPAGSNEAFITPSLSTGMIVVLHSGYKIQMTGTAFPGAPPSCNGLGVGEAGQAFKAAADPIDASSPRFFATNANMTLIEDGSTLFATFPEAGESTSGHILQ